MRWAIGDVHGCYDEFMSLVDKVKKQDKDAKFVLVGDIIDRGDKTWEMLRWAMTHVDNDSYDSDFMMCIGNHEYEKIYWWDFSAAHCLDYPDRYGFDEVLLSHGVSVEDVDNIINWFKGLPYIIQIDVESRQFYICHSYIPNSVMSKLGGNGFDITDEEMYHIVWDRVRSPYNTDATIISGHTPTVLYHEVHWPQPEERGKIDKLENFVNIDCGLVYKTHFGYANLAAYCLDEGRAVYLYG